MELKLSHRNSVFRTNGDYHHALTRERPSQAGRFGPGSESDPGSSGLMTIGFGPESRLERRSSAHPPAPADARQPSAGETAGRRAAASSAAPRAGGARRVQISV